MVYPTLLAAISGLLKPDNGDEVATVYRYSLGDGPDEYWVVCHYALTEVALKRKLETYLLIFPLT